MTIPPSLSPYSTTDYVHNPDIYNTSLEFLLSQFKDKPRILNLIKALSVGTQIVEDMCFGYQIGMLLPYAIGDQLDKLGGIVGEPRDGLSNKDYRRFIGARIATNRSNGTWDEILNVFSIITSPSTIYSNDLFPAGITLYAHRADPLSELMRSKVRRMMGDIKPGGVTMEIIKTVPGYFGFFEDPDAQGYDRGLWSRNI